MASCVYGYKYYSIGNSGSVYETNATSFTHTKRTSEATKTYNAYSDIIVYKGDLYISSATDITYNSGLSSWSLNNIWWTSTKGKTALNSGYNHKFFEFGGVLFFTDKNKLHKWDGTTATEGALVLPSDWIITDAIVHRNYIYISVVCGNPENIYNTKTKIIIWDSVVGSNRWNEEIELNIPPITAIKELNGELFIFAQDLYKLIGTQYNLIRYSVGSGNWKSIFVKNHNLYFLNSTKVCCLNTLFNAYSEVASQANAGIIVCGYVDYFDVFTTDNKGYRASLNNASAVSFYSNKYNFPVPVNIRRIEVLFNGALTSGATYTSAIYNENDVEQHSQTISFVVDGGILKKSYLVNINHLLSFKYGLTFGHSACADVVSIYIYYEPSERTNTK